MGDPFEKQWRSKFLKAVHDNKTIPDRDLPMPEDNQDLSPVEWIVHALSRLRQTLPETEIEAILHACACRYPTDHLNDVRNHYREHQDIDAAIQMLQERFDRFLVETLQLDSGLIQRIHELGMGLAGVRMGDSIVATKIPKSAYIAEYFATDDPDQKRALYCHCPRIRGGLESGIQPDKVYCHCGAGFYKGIWEDITEKPVQVTVRNSVLMGDTVCTIVITPE